MSERAFTPLGGETLYDGKLFAVRRERFRHADGERVERDVVRHQGAVGIVAHDGEAVWLVRQPREAVAEEGLLEIPAGRLDREGERPEDAARRELAEEVGLGAARWEHLKSYYSSAGFTDETVDLYLATSLHEVSAEAQEDERIEVVRWPLDALADALEECRDAKTLIGLALLAQRLRG